MRFMAWHVDYFKAIPKDEGRSPLLEKGTPLDVGESLLVFTSFEKGDTANRVDIIDKAVIELSKITAQIKVSTIILNPFAHLFSDLAGPTDASAMLNDLYNKLKDRGYTVHKLAFGIFYEIELKAKGHKLARVSRTIT
ncbi:threonyl-tRNA synthetase [mine drainage metagenome]|uniref:Threonyl-tRNA synthetase n=1 Tax=mine drainage metagenome TaxID=410659 RepID=T0YEI1_9ZZZZ